MSRKIAIIAAVACATALLAPMAHAVVPVVFGVSWDGASKTLQRIMDARYGTARFSVATSSVEADPTEVDPFFFVGNQFTAFLVVEVAGNANRNTLAWYEENGVKPTWPGGGIVFDGPASAGASAVIVFPHPMTKFGFMLDPNGPLPAVNAPQGEYFYTNRFYNDIGPDGKGALHEPYDGDVQAIIFDVSSASAPNTWLVAFEDLDSGANPGPAGSADTDNDYNDLVFEVTALGATPTKAMTFGALKELYRH